MAWSRGSLSMASWTAISAGLGLTLLVPAAARAESILVRPGDADLIDADSNSAAEGGSHEVLDARH